MKYNVKYLLNFDIYQIPCANCEHVYIGQTGRNLSLRIKEHKYNISGNHSSALTEHSNQSNEGHCIHINGAKYIHCEPELTKRLIAEAILINQKNVFRNNTPSFDLRVFT